MRVTEANELPPAASVDRAAVLAAEAVIRPHVRRTPVIEVAAKDFGLKGAPLVFKLEFLQASGTFKARGAFANMLLRTGAEAGVVAASGGNHGAAVAYAAARLGHKARIYVPALASPAKIERIRGYGAEAVVGGDTYVEALAASHEWALRYGGLAIHAYDQVETLAGQGTVALEFRQQTPQVDTMLVAVGGGGLIGGMAAYLAGDVKLIGVEPEACPALNRALAAGEPVDAPVGGIAADSLGARRVGSLMFELAQRYIEQSVLVSDEAIAAARQSLWDVLRVVVEPGGAAALAALISGAYVPRPDERVGVLLCGANTAMSFG
jgi:threonine dehydratase